MAEAVTFSCADGEAFQRIVAMEAQNAQGTAAAMFREKSWSLLPRTAAECEYIIHVPEGCVMRHPLRYRSAGTSVHMVIVAGGGARGVIEEELTGVGGVHSVEIFLEEGAQLEFVSFNRAPSDARLQIQQRCRLQAHANIAWKNVTIGGSAIEHNLQSELVGTDASSAIDWMFYAKDREKYSLTARNIFSAPHGGGEIAMKGVAEEQGYVRCDGMIEIGKNGGQTDTYLTQDVLMLDKTSKVDAIPGLEIKTNDVKASHSATVSRVTDEDLFYFGARGIPEREARRMFVEGFLGQIVASIGEASIREKVLAAVGEKYGT